ncbi:MAG: hypothetical protein KDH88_07450 [Chromatiales bacterium]|nr:hypothetical protein [Chromatiales bacterium]
MTEPPSGTGGRTLVSREPWWKLPPAQGQNPMACEWGYLIVYSDGSVAFDDLTRPTDEEIANRKGCR